MKVALLSDCYLPRLGGIEVQVHDLARRLTTAGHEVEVCTITPGPADPVDGVRVHRLGLRRELPGDLLVDPLAVRPLRKLLRDSGFDVAHAHMGVLSPFAMDAVRVSLGLGVPTAVTWHCVTARAEPVVGLAGYVRRWARRGAALSAVSAVAAEPIRRLSAAPVAILPNGIDVDYWSPRSVRNGGAAQGENAQPGNGVRVASAMRLAARKRPLELVQAVREAREIVAGAVDIQLEILGEGPLRGRLEATGAGDWCSLPGRLSREQLRERYRSADVYVAPARLEAFGIAALEARSVGLPVVAPRRSGVASFVVDGQNGLLADDDAGLAAAIARVALDQDLRARMADLNRTERPVQSWPAVVELAEAEYRRAITLRRAGGVGADGHEG
ncbi:glycosyltransferase family 4 protein [Rudaeicoccus suwonensis]|uniref:D-inositol 3-phosphate glycosyltransferase n=1 Tax=Rudaeicoccus suwonensis TaxID=657409 RepID=A0A561E8J1_9MICO|nr:glycosyltransferase family 4 protein [Rudaeicoccus suwonensis]TWE11916.1 glycosyltransferase involved in cell wall biosynthesis [Rudaeicoccus suwonensis]